MSLSAKRDVLFLNISLISFPLNYTIFLNPCNVSFLGLNNDNNLFVLMKGSSDNIAFARVIEDSSCLQSEVKITKNVQLTLRVSIGENVPILPFNGNKECNAVQVLPLFKGNKSDYQNNVIDFFTKNKIPIACNSIFILIIEGIQRRFKVINSLPKERCFSSNNTKVYFEDYYNNNEFYIGDEPFIHCQFTDIAVDMKNLELIRDGVWLPMNKPDLFKIIKMKTSSGVMVYGSEGNGKTSFLASVANILDVPLKFVDCKKLSELENNIIVVKIKEVFDFAKQNEKCLLVFDDINYLIHNFSDCKYSEDKEIYSLFINYLDKSMKMSGFAIIGSAPSRKSIDESLLKYSRFNIEINLDNLTNSQKEDIIALNTRGLNTSSLNISSLITEHAENLSCFEIENLCYNATARLLNPLNSSNIQQLPNQIILISITANLNLDHFFPQAQIDIINDKNQNKGRYLFQNNNNYFEDKERENSLLSDDFEPTKQNIEEIALIKTKQRKPNPFAIHCENNYYPNLNSNESTLRKNPFSSQTTHKENNNLQSLPTQNNRFPQRK